MRAEPESDWELRADRLLEAVTPLGWTVLGLSALSWIVGWRLGWDEFMLVAAGCLVASAGALLFTVGRTALDVTLEIEPNRVVVGEKAVGRIAVTNPSTRGLLPIRLEAPVGSGIARVDLPPLASGASADEIFVVPTTRRAVIVLGPVSSVRGDPLGLARKEKALTGREELYVHPRTVALGGITAGWIRDLEGRTTNDLSTSDVAFHTLREYVPGDDRRHVHWRTTARLGQLMVRQFVDTRRAHLGIVLSVNRAEYVDEDEFEMAVSVAASLGRNALGDGQTMTCVAGSSLVPSGSGPRFLDGLSGVELAGGGNLRESMQRARPHLRNASVVVALSGSGVTLKQFGIVADRYPAEARIACICCAAGDPVSVRMSARVTVLNIGGLTDLARGMHALTRR